MAGDWIKMRVWLRKDPCVAGMADYLAEHRGFMNFVTDPVRRSCDESVYEHITSDVTRAITVSSLLEVWGVARERGDRVDDDLILKHCTLMGIDDICGTPGFGEAMEYVEWVSEEVITDAKGRQIRCVRFPKFFKENESPEDRYKKQHAEAQARYRAKQREEDAFGSDVTRDITVTPREEKRKEEKKEKQDAPRGADLLSDVDPAVARDFLRLRKEKRSPLTPTAVAGIKREAEKAGLTLESALRICCEKGWAGFSASWQGIPTADKSATPYVPGGGRKEAKL